MIWFHFNPKFIYLFFFDFQILSGLQSLTENYFLISFFIFFIFILFSFPFNKNIFLIYTYYYDTRYKLFTWIKYILEFVLLWYHIFLIILNTSHKVLLFLFCHISFVRYIFCIFWEWIYLLFSGSHLFRRDENIY
jgi:hypothetical protein